MVERGFGPCRQAPGNWLVTTAWPDLPGAKAQCLRENCRNSGSGELRSLGKGEFPIFEQGQSHRQFQLPLICPSGLINLHTENVNRGIHAHAYQPDHLFPTRALRFGLTAKRKEKKKKLPKAPQNIQNALHSPPPSRKTSQGLAFRPCHTCLCCQLLKGSEPESIWRVGLDLKEPREKVEQEIPNAFLN